ncbi:MAG: DUF2029 domain-containing protein [Ruminococcaceae bacterium]|nr:DUF2029 domain-containing protein [Oscillospiraceae bacterium]
MRKLIGKYVNTSSYRDLFVKCILISLIAYLLIALCTGGRGFSFIFYKENEDAFMDFFNSIRDGAQGIEAYTAPERKVIYPPMAGIFFLLMSKLTPAEYNGMTYEDRYTWVKHPINIVLISIFVAVSLVLLGLIIYKSLKIENKQKLMLTFVAIFSVPILNMIERGNIMTFAFAGLLIYMATYDSEKFAVRELGIIALAFSFSLKLYPIIFAWILIGDKRYKEFFRCALYSLAFLIIPSFAFGGPSIFVQIVKNILSFSSGDNNAMAQISKFVGIPYGLISTFTYLLFILTALCFAVAPFVVRERWKVWMIGCVTFLAYPALSTTYAWALFIMPIIFLCNDGLSENWKENKRNMGYLIPVIIPFLFLPISITGVTFAFVPRLRGEIDTIAVTVNAGAVYAVITFLAVYTIIDTVTLLVRMKKEKTV